MKSKTKRALLWLAILMAALGLTGIVLAQVSTNFDLSWHLLSGGGDSDADGHADGHADRPAAGHTNEHANLDTGADGNACCRRRL